VDKKQFNTAVGHKVRKLRKERGFSQSEIGALFAMSQDTVSEIERGNRTLDIHQVASLAAYFEKPVSFFFMNISETIPTHKVTFSTVNTSVKHV
jgi:transcriptional regulator with XRE-family HTH domain